MNEVKESTNNLKRVVSDRMPLTNLFNEELKFKVLETPKKGAKNGNYNTTLYYKGTKEVGVLKIVVEYYFRIRLQNKLTKGTQVPIDPQSFDFVEVNEEYLKDGQIVEGHKRILRPNGK